MKLSLPVYAVAAKEFVVLADCIAAAYNKIGLKVPTKIIRSLDCSAQRSCPLVSACASWHPDRRWSYVLHRCLGASEKGSDTMHAYAK